MSRANFCQFYSGFQTPNKWQACPRMRAFSPSHAKRVEILFITERGGGAVTQTAGRIYKILKMPWNFISFLKIKFYVFRIISVFTPSSVFLLACRMQSYCPLKYTMQVCITSQKLWVNFFIFKKKSGHLNSKKIPVVCILFRGIGLPYN